MHAANSRSTIIGELRDTSIPGRQFASWPISTSMSVSLHQGYQARCGISKELRPQGDRSASNWLQGESNSCRGTPPGAIDHLSKESDQGMEGCMRPENQDAPASPMRRNKLSCRCSTAGCWAAGQWAAMAPRCSGARAPKASCRRFHGIGDSSTLQGKGKFTACGVVTKDVLLRREREGRFMALAPLDAFRTSDALQ